MKQDCHDDDDDDDDDDVSVRTCPGRRRRGGRELLLRLRMIQSGMSGTALLLLSGQLRDSLVSEDMVEVVEEEGLVVVDPVVVEVWPNHIRILCSALIWLMKSLEEDTVDQLDQLDLRKMRSRSCWASITA